MKRIFPLILCAGLSFAKAVDAHPHIFITNAVTFVFSGEIVTGLRLQWAFDEVFSSTIIADFDRNGDGAFDAAEVAAIEDGAFANLEEYGYFTHLLIDGQAVPASEIREFSAARDGDQVVYSFFVPLPAPTDPRRTDLRAEIYDADYYVEIVLDPERPPTMEGEAEMPCGVTVTENKNAPYYFGLIHPEQIGLDCREG
ncbi:DUF1007 family protein [Rhodospirillaceae bacterium SYSU D60014]|uniref:DUF1007 family protein n=1 Tax=Virgifigura deserti TaxID=2268457 RepID=UPI000E660F29